MDQIDKWLNADPAQLEQDICRLAILVNQLNDLCLEARKNIIFAQFLQKIKARTEKQQAKLKEFADEINKVISTRLAYDLSYDNLKFVGQLAQTPEYLFDQPPWFPAVAKNCFELLGMIDILRSNLVSYGSVLVNQVEHTLNRIAKAKDSGFEDLKKLMTKVENNAAFLFAPAALQWLEKMLALPSGDLHDLELLYTKCERLRAAVADQSNKLTGAEARLMDQSIRRKKERYIFEKVMGSLKTQD